MNRWEDLEEFLFDNDMDGSAFTSHELADKMDVSRSAASGLIQNYLGAQTSSKSRTLFVLNRTGRTKAAVWHVGARSDDVRSLGRQVGDDFRCRLERHIEPTLSRIGQRNPRALPAAKAVAKGIDAGIDLIESMLT
jgi:hypothetical protein